MQILRFFTLLLFAPEWQNFSFVIGEFISGWSHAAWVKLMPCGPLKDERANDLANIEWQSLQITIARVIFKKKPALCEQQLLLAANKDKEWGMFERWITLLLLFCE